MLIRILRHATRSRATARVVLLSTAAVFALNLPAAASELRPDETVVLFPALARTVRSGDWEVEVRGWVFEPERRPGAATLFARYLGLDQESLSPSEAAIFARQTRLFLVDAERGKSLMLRLGTQSMAPDKTDRNGHFSTTLHVSAGKFETLISAPVVSALDASGAVVARAPLITVGSTGISVISDIDDTIKITHVRDRREMLLNTFVREFQAVPEMAALYQSWAAQTNVAFHYVSASPCQLLPPLASMLHTNAFPDGTVHLRTFDWTKDLLPNATVAKQFKPSVISGLIKSFPGRAFLLVGDSGEHDPEIYGEVARRFRDRVLRIYIRDVTEDPPARYRAAFRGLDPARWQIFKTPSEVSRTPWNSAERVEGAR